MGKIKNLMIDIQNEDAEKELKNKVVDKILKNKSIIEYYSPQDCDNKLRVDFVEITIYFKEVALKTLKNILNIIGINEDNDDIYVWLNIHDDMITEQSNNFLYTLYKKYNYSRKDALSMALNNYLYLRCIITNHKMKTKL